MESYLITLSEIIKNITLNYSLRNLENIAEKFETFDMEKFKSSRNNLLSSIHDSDLRNEIDNILRLLQENKSKISPASIALSIKSSLLVEQYEQSYQSTEIIWTGPDSNIIPLRRTDMALTQLINSATSELLIVTYAVYKIENLLNCIEKAINKNVKVKIVLEDQKGNSNEKIETIINKFGEHIKKKALFYVWPKEKRPFDLNNNGKGVLHVKCATADENILFLSSANLTDSAMNLNMELGVLITGGEQPKNVNKHFNALINNNILQIVKP